VTELVISELLWLNYAAPDKPIYVYINSTGGQAGGMAKVGWAGGGVAASFWAGLCGYRKVAMVPFLRLQVLLLGCCLLLTLCCCPCPSSPALFLHPAGSQTLQGEAVGFETEATAIMDTMAYIRPDIYTLVIGQAFGNAAMILASGKKGYRYALPNARIMTCPPRMNRCVRGWVGGWVLGGRRANVCAHRWSNSLGRQAGRAAFWCVVVMAGAPQEFSAAAAFWRMAAIAAAAAAAGQLTLGAGAVPGAGRLAM
jgi:hypothetical protein